MSRIGDIRGSIFSNFCVKDARTVARKSSSGFAATPEGAREFHNFSMSKAVRSIWTIFSRSRMKESITSSLAGT